MNQIKKQNITNDGFIEPADNTIPNNQEFSNVEDTLATNSAIIKTMSEIQDKTNLMNLRIKQKILKNLHLKLLNQLEKPQ